MSRLLLLRHGQTAWNVERRAQGHTDVPLNDTGRRQAAAAGAAIARLRPAAVWSSDSSRALDTAAAIGLPVHVDSRLREISLGSFEGRTLAEWEAQDGEAYRLWRAGHDVARGGGETYSEVSVRAVAAVSEALATVQRPDDLLVVVSHGGAIRAMLSVLLDLPPAPWSRLAGLNNCCCALLRDSGDGRGMRMAAYGVPGAMLQPDPDVVG